MLRKILKKFGYVHVTTLKERDSKNYSKGYSNAMQQKDNTCKRLLDEQSKKLNSIIEKLRDENKLLLKQHKADKKAYSKYTHELEYQKEFFDSLDPILDLLHLNIGKMKKRKNDIDMFTSKKDKKDKNIKRLFNKYNLSEEEDEL